MTGPEDVLQDWVPLTLAQASFSWMAALLGSTWRANLRLFMVYSWPQ